MKAWQLFDRVAEEYDEVLPFFLRFGASIMSTLDLWPGCRVLDLGAGRGALTAVAAERGADVIAIDASPAMTALTARLMGVHDRALSRSTSVWSGRKRRKVQV